MSRNNLTVSQLRAQDLTGNGQQLVTFGGGGITPGNPAIWDAFGNIVSGTAGATGSTVIVKTSGYTLLPGDLGNVFAYNSATAGTFTLPPSPPTAFWTVGISNLGIGPLTLSPNGLNLDGAAASLTLGQFQGVEVFTDGTNYFTIRGWGAYDLVSYYAGQPPSSFPVLVVKFPRPVTCLGNFAGSVGLCSVNPTGTATFTISKNTTGVGTAVISTGGVVTYTTTSGAVVSYATSDYLTITAPSIQDATLSGPSFTLVAYR